VGGQHHVPAALMPGTNSGTSFIESWMDSGTGLKVVRRDTFLASDGLRTPDRPTGSPVTTVTTEFRPQLRHIDWSPFRRVWSKSSGVLDAKED
jgi:hypothetical protein